MQKAFPIGGYAIVTTWHRKVVVIRREPPREFSAREAVEDARVYFGTGQVWSPLPFSPRAFVLFVRGVSHGERSEVFELVGF